MKAPSFSSQALLRTPPSSCFFRRFVVPCLLLLMLLPTVSRTEDNLALWQCPEPVALTIQANLGQGKLMYIKSIEIQERALYLVKINTGPFRDTKLQIDSTGKLLKIVEKIRPIDLPTPVQESVAALLAGKGRIKQARRVTVDEKLEYHVLIDQPQLKKVELVFDENGGIAEQK